MLTPERLELIAEIDHLVHRCEKAERQVIDLHDDVEALQAKLEELKRQAREREITNQALTHEVISLMNKLVIATNALGQIKSITDDCQHMSRFAANKFDEIIDVALKKLRGET